MSILNTLLHAKIIYYILIQYIGVLMKISIWIKGGSNN